MGERKRRSRSQGAQPAARLDVKVSAGPVRDKAEVTGVKIDKAEGPVTVTSTVNQIQRKFVKNEYVRQKQIVTNFIQLGSDGVEEIAAILAQMVGVDKEALRRQPAAAPEHVKRQIEVVTTAQKEVAAKGIVLKPKAAYNLGMLAWYSRDYDTALDYFHQATQEDPNFAEAFKAAAMMQQSRAVFDLDREDHAAAMSKLADARTAAMHTDPLDLDALALRGYISKTLAQLAEDSRQPKEARSYYAEAEKYFAHVVALDPENPSAQNGLGNVRYGLGDLDGAIAAYSEAIGLAPTYAAAHHDLAIAYVAKMKADPAHASAWRAKALGEWREAYHLVPSDPGFPAEAVLRIGQEIAWLEAQSDR